MNKLSDMMKGLADLQGTMDSMGEKMQEKMKTVQVEGVSATGMVKIVLKGDLSVESVYIDDSLLSDGANVVSDLVRTALSDGLKKLKQEMKDNALGGLPLPDGLKMPF